MTLDQFLSALRNKGISTTQWCHEHGLPYVNTIQVAKGTRRPGPELARKLHSASKGRVPLKTLRKDLWG